MSVWKLGLSSGTLSRAGRRQGRARRSPSAARTSSWPARPPSEGTCVSTSSTPARRSRRPEPFPRSSSAAAWARSPCRAATFSSAARSSGRAEPTRSRPGGLRCRRRERCCPGVPPCPRTTSRRSRAPETTIYLAGAFKHVSGKPRIGLAAVSALGTGKLLPWHPRALPGVVRFAGGHAGAGIRRRFRQAARSRRVDPFRHLFVFSARSGRRLRFDSRIGHVNLMAGGHGFVVAENSCGKGVGRPAKSCVTAFRVEASAGPSGGRRSPGGSSRFMRPHPRSTSAANSRASQDTRGRTSQRWRWTRRASS